MSNIAELKKIKEALEVLINESEKPKFEVGWLKLTGYNVFCYTTDFKSGYGISHKDAWTNKMFIDNLDYWEKATPSEVQEALTKEAVKRGFKEGVKLDRSMFKEDEWNYNLTINKSQLPNFWYNPQYNALECYGSVVFINGIFATPIKTKTIDEISDHLSKLSEYGIKQYLTENKQEIIETLNNL